MPEHPNSHRDISAVFNERRKTRDAEIVLMNEVEMAINGLLPETYKGLFEPTDIPIKLQTTRSAYDGLRRYLSEIPVLPHVDPLGKRDSNTQRTAAEVVEKVALSYHQGAARSGGPGFDTITSRLADYQVGFYDAVLLVQPNYENRSVFFEPKDPRCHFPPTGWSPWSMTPLDGTLLVFDMTLAEVKRRYVYKPDGTVDSNLMGRLNNAYRPSFGPGGDFHVDDAQTVQVGMYRARDAWFIVCLSDNDVVLRESQTGDSNHPGVCGVVSFKQPGSPLLLGQVGIEAALTKVVNQQIQNTERINRAPITGPPLLGDTLRWGEYNVIDLGMLQNRNVPVQRHAPDSPNNLNQVMAAFLALAEKFNYNPESNMGQGPANSGKAIQQLQAGPRSLVTSILFAPYKSAFPRAYDDGMEIELNLWPNERKTARGQSGKQTFEIEYTPSAALQGYKGHIKIEDARPGGYNAFLEETQKLDAGMTDIRSALEKDPDVKNVEEALRRIESDSVEKFTQAAFEALSSSDPRMAIKAAAEIKNRLDEGMSKFEAIQEVINAGLLEPPPPEEMAGGMPPIPPELMGGMEADPMASLASARGF